MVALIVHSLPVHILVIIHLQHIVEELVGLILHLIAVVGHHLHLPCHHSSYP